MAFGGRLPPEWGTVGRMKRKKAKSVRGMGGRRKKLDVEKMVDRAVELATGDAGKTKNRLDMESTPVKAEELSDEANRFLKKTTGIGASEFYTRVTAKLQDLVDSLADDLKERHHEMPPQNLAYALGVVIDKANVLSGRPQALTANVNVGFGPKKRTREEILALLSGDVEEMEAEKVG